jgi:arylmalonate decarboxylase
MSEVIAIMDSSRREFLKVSAAGLAGVAAASAAEPVLGMIFPPANYEVPPEAKLMYPQGIRFLAKGVGLERMTPEGYDKAVPKILPAAEELAKQGANAISIMGTSLTFYKGAAFNNDLIAAVAKATGLPTTSMSRGIVEGLKAVGAKRVAVATAYNETVNGRLRVFLEESGFQVLGVKGMGIERFEDRPPVTQDELFNFGATAYESISKQDRSKADTLLISCGALNTLRLLDPLEKRCKVPVVSSAPHALWASVRLLGLSGQAKGYGRLLSRA